MKILFLLFALNQNYEYSGVLGTIEYDSGTYVNFSTCYDSLPTRRVSIFDLKPTNRTCATEPSENMK